MASMKFRLLDEIGKAPDISGAVEAHPDGVYISFDRDQDFGPRVGVQLYDGKLTVFVFAKGERDEPTHEAILDVPMNPKDWSPRR